MYLKHPDLQIPLTLLLYLLYTVQSYRHLPMSDMGGKHSSLHSPQFPPLKGREFERDSEVKYLDYLCINSYLQTSQGQSSHGGERGMFISHLLIWCAHSS